MKKLLVVTGLVLSSILSYGQEIEFETTTLRYNGKLISLENKGYHSYKIFRFNKNLLSKEDLIELMGTSFCKLDGDVVTAHIDLRWGKLPKFITVVSNEKFIITDNKK